MLRSNIYKTNHKNQLVLDKISLHYYIHKDIRWEGYQFPLRLMEISQAGPWRNQHKASQFLLKLNLSS